MTVFTGGKHTFESQYVVVNTRSGRMVVASDNVYLYGTSTSTCPSVNVGRQGEPCAQDRMRQLGPNRG